MVGQGGVRPLRSALRPSPLPEDPGAFRGASGESAALPVRMEISTDPVRREPPEASAGLWAPTSAEGSADRPRSAEGAGPLDSPARASEQEGLAQRAGMVRLGDRKSTRLNS